LDLKYDRVRKLFGDRFEKIRESKVIVLGAGGVGGICVECLARSGVGEIVLVDFDRFDITNQNRQIYSEYVDRSKVDIFSRKYQNIRAIEARVTREWLDGVDLGEFDIVVDAIDDIRAKVEVAHRYSNTLISSLGSAKRVDPSLIEISSIWKSYGDPFAKKFRYELKKSGFNKDFLVVFSSEEPKCNSLGSFMGVTGSFGFRICSEVIKRIVG
jgi:tRNA A37 threonylcarbamoyladenosine dehydratase